MTEASTSRNAKLYVKTGTGSTAGDWVQIKQMIEYPELGQGTMAKLETTNLDNVQMRTYCEDLSDMPELTFTFVAMPYTATDSNVKLVMDTLTDKAYEWKVVVPELGVQATLTADWSYRLSAGAVSTVNNLIIELAGRSEIVMSTIEG